MPTAELRKFEKVCEILQRHAKQPSDLIPILKEVQDEYRYLPEEVMTFVATSLGLSPAKVFGVASFYAHFALQSRGKCVLRLCDGTACHVKGSEAILSALKAKLGLSARENTTADMLFTLETVSCLGACGLAPVLVVDDRVHGQVAKEEAIGIVDDILKEGSPK
jgi:NADH-quinone oxidoreductase subunit E